MKLLTIYPAMHVTANFCPSFECFCSRHEDINATVDAVHHIAAEQFFKRLNTITSLRIERWGWKFAVAFQKDLAFWLSDND